MYLLMSTARLRRTSKYPPNDSDEDDTGVLDEEGNLIPIYYSASGNLA